MSESEGGLAAHVGRIVELRYADGAITRGKLLDIDPDNREELTYELHEVVYGGGLPRAALRIGTRIVVELHELADARLVE
jgi:hypothetical protein